MQYVLENKSQEQGISIARDVSARATDLILINDLYSLHKLLVETKENYPDVRYAFVVDSKNQVLAHTFGDGFPIELINVNHAGANVYQKTILIDSSEGAIWDVAVPIFDGKAGTARIGISDNSVQQTLKTLLAQLGWTVLAVLAGSLLAATALTWVLTKPILKLVEVTKKVAKGDFSPRVERWANDEIGDLEVAFNRMTEELEKAEIIRKEREHLRRQLLEGVILAQEEERRRIARELHDSTSQSLSFLMIGLKNLENYCDDPEITSQVARLREEAGKTLGDVHALALQLRPSVLDDLGLMAALTQLVSEWQEHFKVNVDLLVHIGKDRLPGSVETALYRIIQEALTNIAKHADADSASVLVEQRNGDVVAIVEDNGVGFDIVKSAENGRLGLLGMKERAELLNGKLVVESSIKQGTSIFASIPIFQYNEHRNA